MWQPRYNKNKMALSINKTMFQLFTLYTEPQTIRLRYNDTELQRTTPAKYFNITLGKKLSWQFHTGYSTEKYEPAKEAYIDQIGSHTRCVAYRV